MLQHDPKFASKVFQMLAAVLANRISITSQLKKTGGGARGGSILREHPLPTCSAPRRHCPNPPHTAHRRLLLTG